MNIDDDLGVAIDLDDLVEVTDDDPPDIHSALRWSPTKRVDPTQYREAQEEACLAHREPDLP